MTLLNRTLDKRIAIKVELTPSQNTVMGDPNQIYQVILNLAINARDAIMEKFLKKPEPSMSGEIIITTEVAKHLNYNHASLGVRHIRVSVKDNGCGFSKNIEKKIFEPFFTTKKQNGNSGMGLAMVYGIVASHNGLMNVSSKENSGTTFQIHLPLSVAEIKEEIPEEIVTIEQQQGTILLIDDEELVRSSISTLLRSMGYQTFCAGSGTEALAVYESVLNSIDLVVIDLMMPGIDIQSCLRRLRSAKPTIKILLTSGYGLREDTQQLVKESADGFIQKPFKLNDFSKLIRATLARRMLRISNDKQNNRPDYKSL